MKKSFLKKRAPQSEDMALQITSMADIFIIVLVFLLKGYSTGAITVAPSAGLSLPQAETQDASVEALKVEITEGAVQVEGQQVAKLEQFRFDKGDLQATGISTALGQAISRQREKQLLIAKANSDVKVDAKIMILADQRAPYSTVKTVLASAAVHGYTDFKLAVVKGD
ncbi:MAG TPA: hypothetical protein DCS07_15525 [Bdellovibrionales bacterium]|nr:MAG: hypothetical protein A2X97_10100 [Bdellovibrionales bacterium GWA1_52_35]OFZ40671.1 MAG: hypothetical protein A2070_03780 [Bdellovibrionales bacterium GWC1_52_8]HAR44020.1 hypothetical protein [Bdellovibrionales bacterium]HCM40548.1 hypothetical protein [Bdellovibrionales bacterium]